MKILGIILAVLMLAGSAFVSIAGARKAKHLASEIHELTSTMSSKDKAALSSAVEVPSQGRLNTGAIAGWIAALAALALLIGAFAKKSAVPALAALAIGIAAASAVIFPHVQTGPMDGMAPRVQALVATVLAVIGAGGALLAARKAKA